jgi:hypothetical protein
MVKSPVENFIHRENVKNFKKRLAAPTDETQRTMLLRLLAEEEAKGEQLVAKPNTAVLGDARLALDVLAACLRLGDMKTEISATELQHLIGMRKSVLGELAAKASSPKVRSAAMVATPRVNAEPIREGP